MGKIVYSVLNEGETFNQMIRDAGLELVLGNGSIEEDKLKACSALVPGTCVVNGEVLDKAENLEIVSKFGVGYDKIDVQACTDHKVWISTTPLCNYVSVSEHVIAVMMAAVRKLRVVTNTLQTETPDWKGAKSNRGNEVCGKTLSVIGLGRIGHRVAGIAHAMEMEIVGYDPFLKKEQVPDYVDFVDDLDEALKRGDVITLHVAGSESTRDLINAENLALMKPSAILINTTRGFVVNEAALIDALQNKKIGGAALDVWMTEPITEPNPLLTMDNVIATPHAAANTVEAQLRMQKDCATNIFAAFKGEKPPYALNQI